MLISNNNIVAGDVVVMRLNSGEEIIGRAKTCVALDFITITYAKRILLQMGPQGVAATLAPFMVGADEAAELTIRYDSLTVRPIKASKDMADPYVAQTSPIMTPSRGGIIV